jgi:hypothetical protein
VSATGAARRLPLRWLLRAVPLGLLAVVIGRERPWTVPLQASLPFAVAATLVLNFAVYLPIKAARWRVALTDPPPFRQVLGAMIEGLLANAAFGFGTGDLVRAARLRRASLTREPSEGSRTLPRRTPLGKPSSVHAPGSGLGVDYASAWAERGAELLALAMMIFAAAFVTRLGRAALIASGAAAAAYLAALGAGRLLVPRLGRWPRAQQALASGLEVSTPRRVAAMVALSLCGWATEIVMLLLFQGAFHLGPSFGMALLTLVGINAAIAIPTLPGNFGTFETGAALGLIAGGAPHHLAVGYALAYHLTHVIPVAVIATGVYWARSSRRYRTTPARTSTGR